MKKLIIRLLLIISFTSISDEVELDKAITVAQNFALTELDLADETMSLIDSRLITLSDNTETIAYYIFNFNASAGFIIVSGQDVVEPVLGYSTSSTYNPTNIPNNFNNWINQYANGILESLEANSQQDVTIEAKWMALTNGVPLNLFRSNNSVDPLLSTTWDQQPYYNALCPGGSVTGCVATAMAQIMNYWEYPSSGTGFHSYNEDDYGTLSVNFSNTTYDWANMPNNVTFPNTAVATLMYHCGVSVNMNYSPASSGAQVLDSYWVDASVETALPTYFDYNENTITGIMRSNYNTNTWIQSLKNELNAGRPMEYAGFGTDTEGNTSGHAFVCDGYDNLNYFHFNWGWGGWYDGFFLVDDLNPTGTGTGGGSGTYNDGQQVLIGIQPNEGNNGNINGDINLAVYSDVSIANNPIYYFNQISLSVDVANYGEDTFEGDLCAALFNSSGVFVDYIEILPNISLQSGYYDTYTFFNSGMLSALPGNYNIGIYYRPTGSDWAWVSENGSYSNWEPFEVTSPNVIELYDPCLTLSSDTIFEGESINIDFNVYNSSEDDNYMFSGIYDLSLYDVNTGEFLLELGSFEAIDFLSGYIYTNNISIYSLPVNLSPGTYLLAGMYLEEGSDNWELLGASYCPNPIELVVLPEAIQPDIYEFNNTVNDAYTFYPVFNNNEAQILTTGSNIHNSFDQDFYKIELSTNYNYSISIRSHDLGDSGNNYTYSNDVVWSYKKSNDNVWSSTYDDVMSNNIGLENGGFVLLSVASLFLGQEGTYLLDIEIERTQGVLGCVDNSACNYNPNADVDDGSCEWISCISNIGCMDQTAINYNALAQTEIGVSCEYWVFGCMDQTACNYNPNANMEHQPIWVSESASVNNMGGYWETDPAEWVLSSAVTYPPSQVGLQTYFTQIIFACEVVNPYEFGYSNQCCEYSSCEVFGCTDSEADNYNPNATVDDGSCEVFGCTDSEACNYNPLATNDDWPCEYADPGYNCDGDCLSDVDGDGICDGNDMCEYDADNDIDGDGVCGDVDNCPQDYNPNQEDFDFDNIGDACDGVNLSEAMIQKKLICVTDILGRIKSLNNPSAAYLYIYDDGSIERKYLLKE